MFLLYYLINYFKVQPIQNAILSINKSCIYIQQSIKIYLLDCLELRLDFLFKMSLYLKKKMVEANSNIFECEAYYVQPADFSLFYL